MPQVALQPLQPDHLLSLQSTLTVLAHWRLQDWNWSRPAPSFASPQYAPPSLPYLATSRLRFWTPAQDCEHVLQADHGESWQSMSKLQGTLSLQRWYSAKSPCA